MAIFDQLSYCYPLPEILKIATAVLLLQIETFNEN